MEVPQPLTQCDRVTWIKQIVITQAFTLVELLHRYDSVIFVFCNSIPDEARKPDPVSIGEFDELLNFKELLDLSHGI